MSKKTFTMIALASYCCIVPMSTASCHDICIKTMPAVAQGNTLINGAQDALIQAEAAFQGISDDTTRAKAMTALLEARSSLRVAESLLHSATQACSEPNLPGIFQAFSGAWKVVRTYLSAFGGATGVSVEVKDPIAYTVGKGK